MKKPYRQAIMGILLKSDGSFLIGSSPRDGGYKFPQGGLELYEKPEDGLIREVLEELAIEIARDKIFFRMEKTVKYPYPNLEKYASEFIGQEMFVFGVRLEDDALPVAQDDEFDQFHWIQFHEMTNYDFQHRTNAYNTAIQELLKFLA
ncbi:MAG: NUDIX hydrolase [Flavobacteriales bacterium]|nr:NUDIX hydrolase [Flavobacteriales bacterium]